MASRLVHIVVKMFAVMLTVSLQNIAFAPQSNLSLLVSGRTTGLVVEIGFTSTYIVPIVANSCILSSVKKFDMGGKHLTDFLHSLLLQSGWNILTNQVYDHIDLMKQKYCYSAFYYDDALKSIAESSYYCESYELPGMCNTNIVCFKTKFLNNKKQQQQTVIW